MRITSIRKSLTLWYLLSVATLLVVFTTVLLAYFKSALLESMDASLMANAKTILLHEGSRKPSQQDVLRSSILRSLGIAHYPTMTQIVDLSSVKTTSTLTLDRLPLSDDAKRNAIQGIATYETYRNLDRYAVRVLSVPIMVNSFFTNRFVQVATSLRPINVALKKVLMFSVFAVPVCLLAVIFGGIVLSNRALRPIRQMAQRAKEISIDSLDQTLVVDRSDNEINELAYAFNSLLKRLHAAFDDVRRFSSDVSHELKTPLTVIRGQTEMTLRKSRPIAEYVEVLESNLEEVENLTQIVDHLSLLSKLDRNEPLIDVQHVAMVELVSKVIGQLSHLAKQKNVSIHFEDPFCISVDGDPYLLQMVLSNLVRNAIKYTNANDTVEIRTFVNGDNKGLRVIDHGPGIAHEDLPFVFTRFYRADKSRTKATGGSGLGLNIAQSIIESHNGKLSVVSKPDVETVFQIDFSPFVLDAKKINLRKVH